MKRPGAAFAECMIGSAHFPLVVALLTIAGCGCQPSTAVRRGDPGAADVSNTRTATVGPGAGYALGPTSSDGRFLTLGWDAGTFPYGTHITIEESSEGVVAPTLTGSPIGSSFRITATNPPAKPANIEIQLPTSLEDGARPVLLHSPDGRSWSPLPVIWAAPSTPEMIVLVQSFSLFQLWAYVPSVAVDSRFTEYDSAVVSPSATCLGTASFTGWYYSHSMTPALAERSALAMTDLMDEAQKKAASNPLWMATYYKTVQHALDVVDVSDLSMAALLCSWQLSSSPKPEVIAYVNGPDPSAESHAVLVTAYRQGTVTICDPGFPNTLIQATWDFGGLTRTDHRGPPQTFHPVWLLGFANATFHQDFTGFLDKYPALNERPAITPLPAMEAWSGTEFRFDVGDAIADDDKDFAGGLRATWEKVDDPLDLQLTSRSHTDVRFTPPAVTEDTTVVLRTTVSDNYGHDALERESASADLTVKVHATQGGTQNQPPIANDQSVTLPFNTPTAITLTATDPDSGPQALSYTIVSHPSQGTLGGTAPNLTYTPSAGYSGPDSFTFKANDGAADSNVGTVFVSVQSAGGGEQYSWQALGGGTNRYYVWALVVYNGELIAGGDFTNAGGVSANKIAKWNGTSWAPLGSGMAGTENWLLGVHALTVYNSELVAGGAFTTAGSGSANYIAKWNGTSWSPLGSGMGGAGYPYVYALTVYDGELIAGGHFTNAGGNPANYIARWNGTTWEALGSGLGGGDPYMSDPQGALALTGYNGALIAGGNFTEACGSAANYIARWDGTTWHPLGAGMTWPVHALCVYNGELVAGGVFPDPERYIKRWDGSSWRTLGEGMNEEVLALTAHGGELIAGGRFSETGHPRFLSVSHIAKWAPSP